MSFAPGEMTARKNAQPKQKRLRIQLLTGDYMHKLRNILCRPERPESGVKKGIKKPQSDISNWGQTRRLFYADIDTRKVLISEFSDRAVGTYFIYCGIKLLFGGLIPLTQPKADTTAEDRVVRHGFADKAKPFPLRLAQETRLPGR